MIKKRRDLHQFERDVDLTKLKFEDRLSAYEDNKKKLKRYKGVLKKQAEEIEELKAKLLKVGGWDKKLYEKYDKLSEMKLEMSKKLKVYKKSWRQKEDQGSKEVDALQTQNELLANQIENQERIIEQQSHQLELMYEEKKRYDLWLQEQYLEQARRDAELLKLSLDREEEMRNLMDELADEQELLREYENESLDLDGYREGDDTDLDDEDESMSDGRGDKDELLSLSTNNGRPVDQGIGVSNHDIDVPEGSNPESVDEQSQLHEVKKEEPSIKKNKKKKKKPKADKVTISIQANTISSEDFQKMWKEDQDRKAQGQDTRRVKGGRKVKRVDSARPKPINQSRNFKKKEEESFGLGGLEDIGGDERRKEPDDKGSFFDEFGQPEDVLDSNRHEERDHDLSREKAKEEDEKRIQDLRKQLDQFRLREEEGGDPDEYKEVPEEVLLDRYTQKNSLKQKDEEKDPAIFDLL